MKYVFGRKECVACEDRKKELKANGENFIYMEFTLDTLNMLRQCGKGDLANQVMAQYHYQNETLPVELEWESKHE